MISKKYSGKADLVLVSGGCEHAELFSVVISWGNEMNFSLCEHASLAQTVTLSHMLNTYSNAYNM